MPRQARKESGTGIYHVMLRGINRQDILKIKGRFFDPFCNNIIKDKSRYNHICLDRRERNLVRVSTM